jgi:hypothetical protein
VHQAPLSTVAFTLTVYVLCYDISLSEELKYEDGPAKAKQEAACLRIAEQFEIQISHILLPTHISPVYQYAKGIKKIYRDCVFSCLVVWLTDTVE